MSCQGPSLRCRPPPHPSGHGGSRQLLLHPWALPPAGCPGPPAPQGRATQLLPATLHLTPQQKGSMGPGRTREGVIPAGGKSFIQPLAEGAYSPGQHGTLCKNPRHPATSRLSQEPWQDNPCLPPSCPQAMVPMVGILAQGAGASPCSSPRSRLGATPNPHLGGRGGGGKPKGVDKQTG